MMNTLIMLHNSEDLTTLRTYNRERGKSGYLHITNAAFKHWLNGGVGAFIDRDCYDSISIYEEQPGIYRVNIVWITDSCNGDNVRGYVQTFRIPKPLFDSVVRGDITDATHFDSQGERRKSAVHLSPKAHQSIAEMPSDIRRAFSKFMRDHFDYTIPSQIYIYADGKVDFYFCDESPRGFTINGGIILSTHDRRHRNGTHFCHRYSMHT